MRTSKRWIMLAVALVVWTGAVAFAAFGFGWVSENRSVMRGSDMLIGFRVPEQCGFSIGDLGLKEGQWQKYRAVFYAAQPDLDRLRDAFRKKKAHLEQLIYGSADSAAVRADLAEIAGLQSEFERRMVRYIVDLRALLTAQQLKRFDRWVGRAVCPWQ